ncbi:MAG: hypothetical protein AB3N14_16205 [Flavobacteriaceae bacterium]
MKKSVILFLCFVAFAVGMSRINAQEKPQKIAKEKAESEKGPALYDYDPDFLATQKAKRAEIERIRQLIDSLDIPASRRFKLVRDLYKGKETRRLSKILLAETKFEEGDNEGVKQ